MILSTFLIMSVNARVFLIKQPLYVYAYIHNIHSCAITPIYTICIYAHTHANIYPLHSSFTLAVLALVNTICTIHNHVLYIRMCVTVHMTDSC